MIEPTIIHVRPGAHASELSKQIVDNLSENHGYINLDIKKVLVGESDRGTGIGIELRNLVKNSKIISAELIVRMLKKIVYNGQPELVKYILTNFPD